MSVQTLTTGEQVVTVARQYVGAPFKLHGRDKNGIDCVGLVVCIAQEFGLALEFKDYSLTRGADAGAVATTLCSNGFKEVSFASVKVGDLMFGPQRRIAGVCIISRLGGPVGISRTIHCDTQQLVHAAQMRVVEASSLEISPMERMIMSLKGITDESILEALRVSRCFRFPFCD